MKTMEMQDEKRKFYRSHASRHHRGIVRVVPVGCPFVCAYYWNFGRNESIGRYWEFYSVDDMVENLTPIGHRKNILLFRIGGVKSECSKFSLIALKQLICADVDTYPAVMGDLFGTDGIERLTVLIKERDIHTRIETEYLERCLVIVSKFWRQGSGIPNGIS